MTTDWTKHGATGCTDRHSGTSAAAPIAAGMIALMLEARPCLTWRDVQYIIIMTAQKVPVSVCHCYLPLYMFKAQYYLRLIILYYKGLPWS